EEGWREPRGIEGLGHEPLQDLIGLRRPRRHRQQEHRSDANDKERLSLSRLHHEVTRLAVWRASPARPHWGTLAGRTHKTSAPPKAALAARVERLGSTSRCAFDAALHKGCEQLVAILDRTAEILVDQGLRVVVG